VQNIEAILALQARAEGRLTRQEIALEHAMRALGRPRAVWIILGLAFAWALGNALAGKAALDPPPFYGLQGVATVGALLMTTMILAVQHTQGHRADQRAHLDLQVNLLSEQKIAKLIALLEELRRDLPSVANRRDSMAEAMAEPVDPRAVASVLDKTASKPPSRR
jgi:uncharacterized membrane protein